MKDGKVYWITGLAGAGKTTVGTALFYELKKRKDNVIILDGDILKKITGNEGYDYDERFRRAQRYSNLCKVLADQGITVIICTIAMFESIRRWNRENIEGYVEIYLKVEMDTLIQRDRKRLYSKYKEGKVKNLVGIDTKVELPEHPHLVIENDGRYSVRECVDKILTLNLEKGDQYDRDVAYWNRYYVDNPPESSMPSPFAREMVSFMEPGKSIIDLGCGNGRDSLYFFNKGFCVTGIDASNEVIQMLQEKYKNQNILFLCDDFVRSKTLLSV